MSSLNYNSLLGEYFLQCRTAIKPFPTAEFQHLQLDGAPDVDGPGDSLGESARAVLYCRCTPAEL